MTEFLKNCTTRDTRSIISQRKMIYSQTSSCVCMYNSYWNDSSGHCRETTAATFNLRCHSTWLQCPKYLICELWVQIERPEGSRSSKVIRQSIWHTVGSGSRFLHSACHIPSKQGEPQSSVLFSAHDGKLLEKFPVVWGYNELLVDVEKVVTGYVGL